MKTTPVTGLLLLFMAAGPNGARAQALETPEALYERLAPSIVMIGTYNAKQQLLGLGSGVVIGKEEVITNCHVLRKATAVFVVSGNAVYKATLRYPDPERDLCQMAVRDLNLPVVEIGSVSRLRIGQRVYALGNPRGLERTLSDGLVSALRGDRDTQTIQRIQTTAPIAPGSSGGGLFDARGRLVGITSSVVRDVGSIGFAIPADWIAELPERAAEQLAKYRNRSIAPHSSADPAELESLTAKELAALFRTNREIRMSAPSSLNKLVFQANGEVSAEFSNVVRSGIHHIASSTNRLCLEFVVPARARTLPFLNDCFAVALISGRKYRFTSTDRQFVMEGESFDKHSTEKGNP
jgi:serine protease Do